MKTLDLRIVVTGVLFGLTLAFGVWLSHAGKPYNSMLFNIHKLTALAAVIAAGVTVRHLGSGLDVEALALAAIVLTGLLVLGLFVSGALLSIGKPNGVAALIVHRAAPLPVILSTLAAIYLLARRLVVL